MSKKTNNSNKTLTYYTLQLAQRVSLFALGFVTLLYWMVFVSFSTTTAIVAGEAGYNLANIEPLLETNNATYDNLTMIALLLTAVALILTAILFQSKKSRGGHRAFVANTLIVTTICMLSILCSEQIFARLVF